MEDGMEYIKKIFSYWGYIITRAKTSAWEESEMKGWIKASMVAGVVAGFIWLLIKLDLIQSDIPFLGEIISNFYVQLALGLGAVVVFSISFFFALLYTPAEVYDNQKKKLDDIEKQRNSIKLNLETKIEDYGSLVSLYIKNKNTKDMMDCKITLRGITPCFYNSKKSIIDSNSENLFNFRWKTIDFNDKKDVWGKSMFWGDEAILERVIQSYKTESVVLFKINHGDWSSVDFFIEVLSCNEETRILYSKKVKKSHSEIDFDILLDISFDLDGETITRSYSQKIRLNKKVNPGIKDNVSVYYPSQMDYEFSEWRNNKGDD
jgi:hypothetical protein